MAKYSVLECILLLIEIDFAENTSASCFMALSESLRHYSWQGVTQI
jgi:hypothetical protein